MLTARNSATKHEDLILALLEAVQFLTQVAVIPCKGHRKDRSFITQRKNKADQVPKHTVQLQSMTKSRPKLLSPHPELACLPQCSHRNKRMLKKWGYKKARQASVERMTSFLSLEPNNEGSLGLI